MRLRNIPRAESVLSEHDKVVKDEKTYRGNWGQVFGNSNPIHIEIGMGKGQFLLKLAGRNPQINYIGIERYSSVLLRAVEKYEEEAEEEERFKISGLSAWMRLRLEKCSHRVRWTGFI